MALPSSTLKPIHTKRHADAPLKFTVLYLGGPGSGKTHDAVSWPRPLVVYLEDNTATVRKFPRLDGRVLMPSDYGGSFSAFESRVLPIIKDRRAHELIQSDDPNSVGTIVIDAATSLFLLLQFELQGADGKMGWDKAAQFLYRTEQIAKALVGCAKPHDKDPEKPCYNVVMTAHTKDITNDKGALLKVSPSIYGQMKDILPRYFDTKVLCKSQRVLKDGTVDIPGGTKITDTETQRFVYTVDPNGKYEIGDGVGGGDGRFDELPFVTGGTYPDLMKAWGVQEAEGLPADNGNDNNETEETK